MKTLTAREEKDLRVGLRWFNLFAAASLLWIVGIDFRLSDIIAEYYPTASKYLIANPWIHVPVELVNVLINVVLAGTGSICHKHWALAIYAKLKYATALAVFICIIVLDFPAGYIVLALVLAAFSIFVALFTERFVGKLLLIKVKEDAAKAQEAKAKAKAAGLANGLGGPKYGGD